MKLLSVVLAASAAALPAADADANAEAEALAHAGAAAIASGQEGNHTSQDWQQPPNSLQPAPVPGPWEAINWQGVSAPMYVGRANAIASYPYADTFTTASPAHMSANYTGSKVGFFGLAGLDLGCAQMQSYQGGKYSYPTPVNCTLEIKGYRGAVTGAPAAETTIAYEPHVDNYPGGYPQASYATYDFGRKFTVLRNIVFTPKIGSVSTTGGTPTAPLITYWENVKYHVSNYTA